MDTLVIAALVVFGAACIMYLNVKNISANIYIRTVLVHEEIESDLPASPYSLCPAISDSGKTGYAILKNNNHMYLAGSNGSFRVFLDLESAIMQMNKYEKLDRVRITTLE